MTKKAKELSPYHIIEKSVGPNQDPKRIYAALIKMIEQPNYRILRHNNSLLLIDNKGNGIADGLLYTADPESKQVENAKELTKALKIGQFHRLTMLIPNLQFVEIIKKAELNYSIQNRGVSSFLVTIKL